MQALGSCTSESPRLSQGCTRSPDWSSPRAGERGWCRFVCGTRSTAPRRGWMLFCSQSSPPTPMTHFHALALLTFLSVSQGHVSSWPCPQSLWRAVGWSWTRGAELPGSEGPAVFVILARPPSSQGSEPPRWFWVN